MHPSQAIHTPFPPSAPGGMGRMPGGAPAIPGLTVPPRPSWSATAVILLGCVLTFLMAPAFGGGSGAAMCRTGAYIMSAAMAVSMLIELSAGLRNMVRTDLLMLVAFYGLTFPEFLFSKEGFDAANEYVYVRRGMDLVLVGFVALTLGRHIGTGRDYVRARFMNAPSPPSMLYGLFWVCFVMGFLNEWLSVAPRLLEDPFLWIRAWFGSRWSQPWSRGMLGGWMDLIGELGHLLYVVPALAALIWVRRRFFSGFQLLIVGVALGLDMVHAFAGGTRNYFFLHVILFVVTISYFNLHRPKLLVALACATGVLFFFSANMMLSFRGIGLARYIELRRQGMQFLSDGQSLHVDLNFQSLARLTRAFPERIEYQQWKVVEQIIIRPIPRAIWKNKPLGLAVTILPVLQEHGESLTIALTFAGEAYLGFGLFGVLGFGIALAVAGGFWTRLGNPRNSDLGILIFASGFFPFGLAIRSFFGIAVAMLPTMFLIVVAMYLNSRHDAMPARMKGRGGGFGPPGGPPGPFPQQGMAPMPHPQPGMGRRPGFPPQRQIPPPGAYPPGPRPPMPPGFSPQRHP